MTTGFCTTSSASFAASSSFKLAPLRCERTCRCWTLMRWRWSKRKQLSSQRHVKSLRVIRSELTATFGVARTGAFAGQDLNHRAPISTASADHAISAKVSSCRRSLIVAQSSCCWFGRPAGPRLVVELVLESHRSLRQQAHRHAADSLGLERCGHLWLPDQTRLSDCLGSSLTDWCCVVNRSSVCVRWRDDRDQNRSVHIDPRIPNFDFDRVTPGNRYFAAS